MPTDRERILKTLHTAATDIQACDSIEAACEQTVSAAEGILEYDICSIILHEDGWLEPAAVSSGSPEGGVRRVRADQGLAEGVIEWFAHPCQATSKSIDTEGRK